MKAPESKEQSRSQQDLVIALPEPDLSLTQDAEWCVVRMDDDQWEQVRFHDYERIFQIPGLYERVIYDILKCDSPATIRRQLSAALERHGYEANSLRVLDLGAGNGMVGEELNRIGVEHIVGVDIIPEAKQAAERDCPGVYDEYFVVDMTDLDKNETQAIADHQCNTLTCVAALGFGDIPVDAFANAYNLINDNGWLAFNIKADFLASKHDSGFGDLIRTAHREEYIEILSEERYHHRLNTRQKPLDYMAIIARKHGDFPEELMARVR